MLQIGPSVWSWRVQPSAAPADSEIEPAVHYEYGDDSGWGFLRLDIVGTQITGTYSGVAKDGIVTPARYTFSA